MIVWTHMGIKSHIARPHPGGTTVPWRTLCGRLIDRRPQTAEYGRPDHANCKTCRALELQRASRRR